MTVSATLTDVAVPAALLQLDQRLTTLTGGLVRYEHGVSTADYDGGDPVDDPDTIDSFDDYDNAQLAVTAWLEASGIKASDSDIDMGVWVVTGHGRGWANEPALQPRLNDAKLLLAGATASPEVLVRVIASRLDRPWKVGIRLRELARAGHDDVVRLSVLNGRGPDAHLTTVDVRRLTPDEATALATAAVNS